MRTPTTLTARMQRPNPSTERTHKQAAYMDVLLPSQCLNECTAGTERDACVRACRNNTAYTASIHSNDTKSQSFRLVWFSVSADSVG